MKRQDWIGWVIYAVPLVFTALLVVGQVGWRSVFGQWSWGEAVVSMLQVIGVIFAGVALRLNLSDRQARDRPRLLLNNDHCAVGDFEELSEHARSKWKMSDLRWADLRDRTTGLFWNVGVGPALGVKIELSKFKLTVFAEEKGRRRVEIDIPDRLTGHRDLVHIGNPAGGRFLTRDIAKLIAESVHERRLFEHNVISGPVVERLTSSHAHAHFALRGTVTLAYSDLSLRTNYEDEFRLELNGRILYGCREALESHKSKPSEVLLYGRFRGRPTEDTRTRWRRYG